MREQLVGHVKSIFRYLIKSMQEESLTSIEVGHLGVSDDRAFALRLPDGCVATAKRTTFLLTYHAYCEGDSVMIRLSSEETIVVNHPSTND